MKTVSIISCAREPSYLIETLRGFKESGSVVELIFQGKESPDVIEFLLGHRPEPDDLLYDSIGALFFEYTCQIRDVYRTEKLYSDVHLNGQYNYAQALLKTRDGLIIEDDVQVSDKFLMHLEDVKKLVPDGNCILALYSAHPWQRTAKIELVDFPIDLFFGTQAMWYPVCIARKFGQHLLDNIGKQPYDLALRPFCRENRIKLFASNYSLVQHIGRVSTGLGHCHQTPNFIDDYMH